MRTLETLLPPLCMASMLAALALVFLVVPTEAQMGVVQRIFYFHVGSAWVTYACFFTVAGAGAYYLWKRSEAADRLAYACAEVGVVFCTLLLITGPIWARPIWGVWWTWDPRLTLTVILWGIYVGYLMLRAFGGDDESVPRWAAVLGIVGIVDIPFLRVAVRLLGGIHPYVVGNEKSGGLADPWMQIGLVVSMLALSLLAAWLVLLRVRTERLAHEVALLQRTIELRGKTRVA